MTCFVLFQIERLRQVCYETFGSVRTFFVIICKYFKIILYFCTIST